MYAISSATIATQPQLEQHADRLTALRQVAHRILVMPDAFPTIGNVAPSPPVGGLAAFAQQRFERALVTPDRLQFARDASIVSARRFTELMHDPLRACTMAAMAHGRAPKASASRPNDAWSLASSAMKCAALAIDSIRENAAKS